MPLSTSAMLTVNSSRPARNSRVPSSGSTTKKRSRETLHRPVAGCLLRHDLDAGMNAASPLRMIASEASSAAVTGEESGFSRAFRSGRGTARIAAAAREAISVRPSSSPTISDGSVQLHRTSARRHFGINGRDLSHRLLTLDARIA